MSNLVKTYLSYSIINHFFIFEYGIGVTNDSKATVTVLPLNSKIYVHGD